MQTRGLPYSPPFPSLPLCPELLSEHGARGLPCVWVTPRHVSSCFPSAAHCGISPFKCSCRAERTFRWVGKHSVSVLRGKLLRDSFTRPSPGAIPPGLPTAGSFPLQALPVCEGEEIQLEGFSLPKDLQTNFIIL